MRQVLVYFFYLLPTTLLSRLFGIFARIPFPKFILNRIISWYTSFFSLDMDLYQVPREGFRTLDQFFTRKIREGARPLGNSEKFLLSPVDGTMSAFGSIDENSILQAKGISYPLEKLLPSDKAEKFRDGLFLTIYLSPADYHRIHSPLNGTITGYFSIPGRLYTVQEFMVQGLPGLFAKNERLITYIDTGSHEAALCKIGAMNVGRMSLSYAPVITNKTFRKREEKIFKEDELTTIAAGDETAIFHMGSTIVLLLEKGMCDLAFCEENAPVTMGSPLGNLLKK